MTDRPAEYGDAQAERYGALAGIGLTLVCALGFWRFGWWPFLPLGVVGLVGLVGGYMVNATIRRRRRSRKESR